LIHERGFDDCARICLTHSFPIKHTDAFASRWDCPAEERQFVQDYLDRAEYTANDRLIQLCDALALPSGPVLMEKRLVDVALRHGFNELTLAKWQAYLALRQEFSAAVGGSIYALLPGISENTSRCSRHWERSQIGRRRCLTLSETRGTMDRGNAGCLGSSFGRPSGSALSRTRVAARCRAHEL
jgi:hypothetical protein